MTNSNEMNTELQNHPVAVITGASSGIGFELAKVFARNGFDLIVVAEDNTIYEAANTFRALGVEVNAIRADLSTEEGVELLTNHIEPNRMSLDSVVINAGVGVGGYFMETDLEREIEMINLNVTSAVRLTKKVLPIFAHRGQGRILFTSSIAADMPGPYYAVYAATKAFLQSFSEAILQEVKDKGITVTALQPGATETNFFKRANLEDTKAGTGEKDDPAQVAEQGFKALMEGKDHVVAGSFMNKVTSVIGKIVPETTGAKLQRKDLKPGSAPH